MSSSSDPSKLSTVIVPMFDGLNYKKWSDSLRSFLRYNGLWFLIEGYGSNATTKTAGMARPTVGQTATAEELAAQAAWDEKNDKALGALQLYVAQNLRHLVDNEYTVLAAWTTIKNQYEKPGAVGAFVAFQQLFNTVLSDSASLGPQIDAVVEKSAMVNAAGIEIKPQLVALTIVNALPKSYQALSSTILATEDLAKLTPSSIKPKIVEEEQRRLANKVQVSRVSKAPQLNQKCEKCGRNNHTTEQHWDRKPSTAQAGGSGSGNGGSTSQQGVTQKEEGKKKRGKRGKGKGKGQANTNTTANTIEIVSVPDVTVSPDSESISVSLYEMRDETTKWMLDSGCNCHVTPHLKDFVSYHKFPRPGYAKTAGQSQLIEIQGHGIVYLKHRLLSGQTTTLHLQEVLYVPKASNRFFAPIAPINQGHRFEITKDSFNLYHKKPQADGSPRLIFKGRRDNYQNLYWLDATVMARQQAIKFPGETIVSNVSSDSSFDLWHQRFGHAGKKAVT